MNMNTSSSSTSSTSSTSTTTTINWGFKTPIQFKVALRLAQQFGHQWAQPTWVAVRKPQPNGAIKLVEEPLAPKNPSEAAKAANDRLLEENQQLGFQLAQHTVPTPSWESGSGTYNVMVQADGTYTIIKNAILEQKYAPDGQIISVSLVPRWHTVDFNWDWMAKSHNGRGRNLQESVKLAIKRGGCESHPDPTLIEAFEADSNFWRTGFVAGTRWYE
jgi:hypothetical protein